MYFGSKNHNITPEQDVGIQKLFFCWKALFNTKPLVYVEFLYLVNFGFSLVFYGFSQFFLNFCHFSKSCAIPQPLVKSKIQTDDYIQNVITHLWGQKSKFRQKLLRPPKLIFQMTSLFKFFEPEFNPEIIFIQAQIQNERCKNLCRCFSPQ